MEVQPRHLQKACMITFEFENIPTFDEIKRKTLSLALETFEGNKHKAAEALGISLRTVRNLVHTYGLHHFIVESPLIKSRRLKDLKR